MSSLNEEDLFESHTKITNINLISSFEKKFKIKFPKEYVDLIKNWNAGVFKIEGFDIGRDFYPVNKLINFNDSDNKNRPGSDMERLNSHLRSFDNLKNMVAFLNDGDDGNYCFDFSTNKIVYVVEIHEESEITHICNSFSEFIHILKTKSVNNIHGEEEQYKNKISEEKEIINNLIFIQQHFNKFKVNKESLHLLNSNGNLSRAIQLNLPYCENDIEEENIVLPKTEEVLNKLNAAIFKAINRLFTMI